MAASQASTRLVRHIDGPRHCQKTILLGYCYCHAKKACIPQNILSFNSAVQYLWDDHQLHSISPLRTSFSDFLTILQYGKLSIVLLHVKQDIV